jgi:hypothetical protein
MAAVLIGPTTKTTTTTYTSSQYFLLPKFLYRRFLAIIFNIYRAVTK